MLSHQVLFTLLIGCFLDFIHRMPGDLDLSPLCLYLLTLFCFKKKKKKLKHLKQYSGIMLFVHLGAPCCSTLSYYKHKSCCESSSRTVVHIDCLQNGIELYTCKNKFTNMANIQQAQKQQTASNYESFMIYQSNNKKASSDSVLHPFSLLV